jgi:hypothetical protein
MATRLSSGVGETLWLDPSEIKSKITPLAGLTGVVGGDWDVDRRTPLASAIKHQAIWQRYRDGARWEDTDLFRDSYTRRLKAGEGVRGCQTMGQLLEQYYNRVDGMFEALKRAGFDALAGPLPMLLIGRGGEVFIGNQGNHRLAMAQVLGIKDFAGKVVCKHPLSQQ